MDDEDTLVDIEPDLREDKEEAHNHDYKLVAERNRKRKDEDNVLISHPLSANEVSNIFPAKFTPPYPSDRPDELFSHNTTTRGKFRFLRRTNKTEGLMYAAGARFNEYQRDAIGYGFVYRPQSYRHLNFPALAVYGRLEIRGSDGRLCPLTKCRAELRAVVALLQFRTWEDEGFRRLVVATDSEYVVRGATECLPDWVELGLRTTDGFHLANRDLWDLLLSTVRMFAQFGVEVVFWHTPREWNTEAEAYARKGARLDEVLHFGKRLRGSVGQVDTLK